MALTTIRIPKTEIDSRIKALQKTLQDRNIDAALILQKADLFYFSGTIQDAHLFVPAEKSPVLLVHKNLKRARDESPIARIEPLKGLRYLPDQLNHLNLTTLIRIGLEFDVLPVKNYLQYVDLFKKSDWVDISHDIRKIRAIKSSYEIGCMQQAARLSDRLAAEIPQLVQENMTELALAGKVEALARQWGHQGVVRMRLWGHELFYGHLMAGPASAVGSYLASPTGGEGTGPAIAQGAGKRPIQRNEPILLDYVFVHNGYISDHTRIFSIGPLSDELMEAHQAMQKVQETVKKAAKPGAMAGKLYELATEAANDLEYGDNFMGHDNHRVRFIGHGVGIELDEYPFLAKNQKMKIQKGMAIALEPKLIFPGKGVVGVENTHIVEEEGLRQLGQYPDDITII